MKICSNCGSSNSDAAKFCGECAFGLDVTGAVLESPIKSVDAKSFATSIGASIAGNKSISMKAKRKADIMFILDCTGSMQGEINAIKSSIADFADTIESSGVRVRLGIIEFRDRLNGEEARVLTFESKTDPFTANPAAFRKELDGLRAQGGGDAPESSLDAVMLALKQPFSTDANKVLVLITDAPPHIPDKEVRNIEQVVNAIRSTGIQQLYLVMRTNDPDSQIYLKLLEATRGLAFELGRGNDFRNRADHFKRTLMALGKTISAGTI